MLIIFSKMVSWKDEPITLYTIHPKSTFNWTFARCCFSLHPFSQPIPLKFVLETVAIWPACGAKFHNNLLINSQDIDKHDLKRVQFNTHIGCIFFIVTGLLDPFHKAWAHYWNLVKIMFSQFYSYILIRSQFCKCHDSCAVVTCAKL